MQAKTSGVEHPLFTKTLGKVMAQAYSVSDGTTDVTDAGGDRWIRLRQRTVKVSWRFELDLITSGQVTDPESFVRAVDEFYAYCRETRKRLNRGWTYQTEFEADTAYRMLQRIIEM
jgi:hypothetical protein